MAEDPEAMEWLRKAVEDTPSFLDPMDQIGVWLYGTPVPTYLYPDGSKLLCYPDRAVEVPGPRRRRVDG